VWQCIRAVPYGPTLLFSPMPDPGGQFTSRGTLHSRKQCPSADSRPGSPRRHRRHDMPHLRSHVRAAPLGWPVLLVQMPAARLAAASARRSASEGSEPCAGRGTNLASLNARATLRDVRQGVRATAGQWRQPQRFCSLSCRRSTNNARWRERHKQPRPQTTCLICGAPFAPLRSTRRYCSVKCKNRAGQQQRRQRTNPQAQEAG
jgi:predicted nucleic acid-binding Zn ribbon protein